MDPNWTASDAAPQDARPFYPEPASLGRLPGARRGMTRAMVAGVALAGVTAIALAVAMIGKPPASGSGSATSPASASASTSPVDLSRLPPTGAGPAEGSSTGTPTSNVTAMGPSVEPVPYPAYGSNAGTGGTSAPGETGRAGPSATPSVTPSVTPAATRAAPVVRHEAPVATRASASDREVCLSCGTVVSVHAVTVAAPTTGVGAVGGGAVGALVGSQVAGRGDRTLGAFLGALGGGLVGHQVEKQARRTTVYDVRVRMEDGSYRTLRESGPWKVGAKVNVNGRTLRARNDAT